MPLRLHYIFSLIGLVITLATQAQDSTLVAKSDTRISLKNTGRTGLELAIDYGKLASIPSEFETKYEAAISWTLGIRFSPNLHYGQATLSPATAFENGEYESKGWYIRGGLNYLLPLDNVNTFYAGLKYGMSHFDDSGYYAISSNLWEDVYQTFERTQLEADWFEITFGSEHNFRGGHFAAGGSLSIRILHKYDSFEPIDVYAIPGYGRTIDSSVPALNLYIKFRL